MQRPYLRRRRLLRSLLLWLSASCGDDGASPQSELLLGSGESRFEALEPGAHLELEAGSQGGHHVWLSLRAQHLEPEDVRMLLEVVPSPPSSAAQTDVILQFSEAADEPGWVEFVGWPARVLNPACAVGQPLELRVTLTDSAGREVSETLSGVLDPPRGGLSAECEK